MASAGQDRWIAQQFPPHYAGWGIDVGAADGMVTSNTYWLEAEGWNIMCVEAMPLNGRLLRRSRRNFMICAADSHAQEWGDFWVNTENPTAYSSLRPKEHLEANKAAVKLRVPVLTLNQIFCISGFPQLDLISVDVEGTELDVLKGLDIARFQPRVIMCECWPHTDAADKVTAYLEPFGYRDMMVMEHDHGFIHVGNARRTNRPTHHEQHEAVEDAGRRVPLRKNVRNGVPAGTARRIAPPVEAAEPNKS